MGGGFAPGDPSTGLIDAGGGSMLPTSPLAALSEIGRNLRFLAVLHSLATCLNGCSVRQGGKVETQTHPTMLKILYRHILNVALWWTELHLLVVIGAPSCLALKSLLRTHAVSLRYNYSPPCLSKVKIQLNCVQYDAGSRIVFDDACSVIERQA